MTQPSRGKKGFTDKQRLDWLALQIVEVRTPLRYGSKAFFYGSADIDEEGLIPTVPNKLRAAIDAALRQESKRKGKL